jgi:hypothetical protein
MRQLDYVQHLLMWAVFWAAVFLAWFETAPRVLGRVHDRRRR